MGKSNSIFLQLAVLWTSLFAASTAITCLFPFLPRFIRSFDSSVSEEDVGYYVGVIGTSFMIGRAVSSVPWGAFSDKFGRKPTMVVSVASSIVCSLLFGVSESLVFATAIRFLSGFLNPAAGISKAYVAEIAGPAHAARGMTVVGVAWGTGVIAGSAIGGVLSEPAIKYPSVFSSTSIFATYPFLLPNVIVAAANIISLPLLLYYLPETIPNPPSFFDFVRQKIVNVFHRLRGRRVVVGSGVVVISGGADVNGDGRYAEFDDDDGVELVKKADVDDQDGKDGNGQEKRRDKRDKLDEDGGAVELSVLEEGKSGENAEEEEEEEQGHQGRVEAEEKGKNQQQETATTQPPKKRFAMMRDKGVLGTIAVYSLHSCADLMFFECVPVLSQTSQRLGGFGLDSTDVGLLLMIAGAGSLVVQVVLFPMVCKRFGSLFCFRGACILTGIAMAFTPFIAMMKFGYIAIMVVAGVALTLRQMMTMVAFTSNFLLINNSVYLTDRGKVNGIAMMLGSLFKAIGPIVGTSLFAWSLSSTLPGVNAMFVFILMGCCDVLCGLAAFVLSPTLNKPKV